MVASLWKREESPGELDTSGESDGESSEGVALRQQDVEQIPAGQLGNRNPLSYTDRVRKMGECSRALAAR